MGGSRESRFKMNTRNQILYVFVLSFLITGYLAAEETRNRADFNVEVMAIDDEGEPVEGASLGFSWGIIGGKLPDTGFARKLSDSEGVSRFSGNTVFKEFAYGGVKDGYYSNGGLHSSFVEKRNGEWQPSPLHLSVILKRVRNPVPMYAKEVNLVLPGGGEPYAFDLVEGDWVAPLGRGKERDIEFLAEGQYQSKINYNGTLTLRFLGDGSGVLPYDYDQNSNSELKMPYEAPMSGYLESWSWKNARVTGSERFARSTFDDDTGLPRGFIFRVRTVVDSEGEVVNALYGKIQGRFYFRLHEGGGGAGRFYLLPKSGQESESRI